MTTETDECRKAFENWHYDHYKIKPYAIDELYQDATVHTRWIAWQASRADLLDKQPVDLEKCVKAVRSYNANTHECSAEVFAIGLIKAVLDAANVKYKE